MVECLSDSYQISQYFGGSLEEFLVSNCAECQESQQVLRNLSNTSQLIEVRLRRSLLKRKYRRSKISVCTSSPSFLSQFRYLINEKVTEVIRPSIKHQASSTKHQAPSMKHRASREHQADKTAKDKTAELSPSDYELRISFNNRCCEINIMAVFT